MHFTIITPNLNGGRFLRDCLSSVASQKDVEIEHWVMDGGSTDDSEAIARTFPHVRWHQEPDKGMSDAINKGFDLAMGDWVMWLNSDDWLKPGSLARLKAIAERHTEADVIYGDFEFADESGAFIRRLRLPPWSPFVSIHHCCYVPSTATVLRRATVIASGFRLREDFHCVMDGEYYARLHLAGKRFVHLEEPLAVFRLHGKNASLRNLGKDRDMDRIVRAELQHVESRSIRRAYGITLFEDPYLNGLLDGILWIVARAWKLVRRVIG